MRVQKHIVLLAVLLAAVLVPKWFLFTELSRITALKTGIHATQTDVNSGGDLSSRIQSLRHLAMGETGVLIALILFAVGGLFAKSARDFRRIARDLDGMAGKIDATSYALKSTSALLADDTRRQSAALLQTGQAHKSVATLSRENAEHATEADRRIQAQTTKLETADRILQALIDAMGEIQTASEGIKTVMADLNTIATQTNLLAINAGVEAARAGEAGKAFGVIAGEVRNLAVSSGNSALQTSALISDTIEKIQGGAATVGRVVDVFRETVSCVTELKGKLGAISTAAREQSEQLQGLEASLTELETLTDRNVYKAETASGISAQLRQDGEALREAIGEILSKAAGCRTLSENALASILSKLEALRPSLPPGSTGAHTGALSAWKQRQGPQIEAVYTCRGDGTFVYSNPPAGIPNAKIRPWWQVAMTGETYVSPLYVSAITQKPCCTVSVPLYGAGNRIDGVLGVDIKV